MRHPTLCLLKLNGISILEQLQIEEALLRLDQRSWFIWNTESTPAIVLGISGKVDQMVDLARWSQNQVPLIRRFSGGGTVIIDRDTCFTTFIGNADELGVSAQTQAVHQWTVGIFQAVFSEQIGFRLRENDYVMDDKKCGGNAQYLSKNRWLHHTSFLWNFCTKRMELLTMPPKMPEYRAQRLHSEFLCTLESLFNSKKDFQDKLIETLSSRFTLEVVEIEAIRPLLEKPHRKATALINPY